MSLITWPERYERSWAKSSSFVLLESKPAQPLIGFHTFADGLPCLGAFLIAEESAQNLWILIIDWKRNKDFYVVVYPERHNSPPIAELHNQRPSGSSIELSWSYRPSKRDGRNAERKEAIRQAVGTLEFIVSIPGATVSLDDFLSDLFSLASHRIAADKLEVVISYRKETFPEGRRIERLHRSRERDSTVVKLAKTLHARRNKGKLPCEVCGFDFSRIYGELGNSYIEAHHTKPLGDLVEHETQETKVDELALVCANCHRMLHRQRPWATIDQIRELIEK